MFATLSQLLEQDSFQDSKLRSTTGLGIGRQFIDTGRHQLAASIATGVVYQNFNLTGTTTMPSWLWGVQWEYELIKDTLELWHRQSRARDLAKEAKAWRLNADQGIRADLWDDFYLNLEVDLRFNSNPDLGKVKTDSALIFGVGYSMSN